MSRDSRSYTLAEGVLNKRVKNDFLRKRKKLQRSASDGSLFAHSWDHNSTDVTVEMYLPRVGNLRHYLIDRWRKTTVRKLERVGSGTAGQLTELSEESTEETHAFNELRRHSFTEAQKKEISTEVNNKGDTVIVAGTIRGLTSLLVEFASSDNGFVETFLYTHNYWINSVELMAELKRIYWDPNAANISPSPSNTPHTPGFEQAVKKRIIRLVHKWIERFPFDFSVDEALQASVREFVQKLSSESSHELKWGEILLKALQEASRYTGPVFITHGTISLSSSGNSSLNSSGPSDTVGGTPAAEKSTHSPSSSSSSLSTSGSNIAPAGSAAGPATSQTSAHPSAGSPPIPKRRSKPRGIMFKERMSPRKMQFLDLDTRVLAKQLSLFDHRQLRRVVPSELVCNNWSKGKGEHVIAIRERNNLVAQWVASEIVSTPNLKQRVVVLTNFIELCLYLRDLRNFQSCFNIFCGIRKQQTTRLTKTWAQLDPHTVTCWQELEKRLKALTEFYHEAVSAAPPKVLPCMIFLRFLGVQEQEPTFRAKDQNMINFTKMRNISQILRPILECQEKAYNFDEIQQFQTYLEHHITSLDNPTLTKLSLEIEPETAELTSPRGTSQEKSRVSVSSGKKERKEEKDTPSPSSSSGSLSKDPSGSNLKRAATTGAPSTPTKDAIPVSFGPNQAGKRRKTRDEILVDIRQELDTKRVRPLAKCSVGSDLPRFIRKIILINGEGDVLWSPPANDEEPRPVTDDIYGFLKAVAEHLDCKKEAKSIEKMFNQYFGPKPGQTDRLKETTQFVNEVLGEESVLTRLLKVSASQGIISPAWVRLRLFIFDGVPFKDAKKGWKIYVIIEGHQIRVCHIKKEHALEETAGKRNFEFKWEMHMAFDRKLEMLYDSKLVISDFSFANTVPAGKRKEIQALAAPWLGDGFRNTKRRLSISESADSGFQPAPSPFAPNTIIDEEKKGFADKLKPFKKKKKKEVLRSTGSNNSVNSNDPSLPSVKKETKFMLPDDTTGSSTSHGLPGDISPRTAREQLRKSPPGGLSHTGSGGNLPSSQQSHPTFTGGKRRDMSESSSSKRSGALSSSHPVLPKNRIRQEGDESDSDNRSQGSGEGADSSDSDDFLGLASKKVLGPSDQNRLKTHRKLSSTTDDISTTKHRSFADDMLLATRPPGSKLRSELRKSLELKNLDVVREMVTFEETSPHGFGGPLESARVSKGSLSSKTPRNSDKDRDRESKKAQRSARSDGKAPKKEHSAKLKKTTSASDRSTRKSPRGDEAKKKDKSSPRSKESQRVEKRESTSSTVSASTVSGMHSPTGPPTNSIQSVTTAEADIWDVTDPSISDDDTGGYSSGEGGWGQ